MDRQRRIANYRDAILNFPLRERSLAVCLTANVKVEVSECGARGAPVFETK